jgi:Uma2 family endonuclease
LNSFDDDGIVVVEVRKGNGMLAAYRVRRKRRREMMSTAEYLQTEETVLPRELAYGVLRVAEAPSASHQRVVRDLTLELFGFVRDRQLGEVLFAPMDVILDAAAALVVQPDVLFVSRERQHVLTDRVHGAPDLVIEVLSPHPRIGQLEERVGWFAKYGVRECWLARLPEKQIVVLTLANGVVTDRALFTAAQPIRSAVLDGLRLTPLQVFGW